MAADFPVDPADRPTDLPKGYGKRRGPWDDVTVESRRAEPRGGEPSTADDTSAGQDAGGAGDDPALQALAEHFDSGSDVPADVSESDTDTFPRVDESAGEDAAVPTQQRKGMRAFAERAMGGH